MPEMEKATWWDFVKGVSVVALIIGVAVKIFTASINFTLDFPNLLSLLLALFSVGLSAIFYFKATESSNMFYDNTYKYTKDIAQLLAKMESGFGERLRNLDEGYSTMRGYFQNGGGVRSPEAIDATTQKLREEKLEMERVIEERNIIVKDLIERSQLDAEVKEKFESDLKAKESQLRSLQDELTKLTRRKTVDRVRRVTEGRTTMESFNRVRQYTKNNVLEVIGGADFVVRRNIATVTRLFNKNSDSFNPSYIEDLVDLGYFLDGSLTDEGAVFIKGMAVDIVDG